MSQTYEVPQDEETPEAFASILERLPNK
jgi:hypothetical protein